METRRERSKSEYVEFQNFSRPYRNQLSIVVRSSITDAYTDNKKSVNVFKQDKN